MSIYEKFWKKTALSCLAVASVVSLGGGRALAVSCVTQAEMKAPERDSLAETARSLASSVQAGNVDAVKAKTVASVASDFDGIAGSIRSLTAALSGASLRVTSLYVLDAADATGQDSVQFFCGQAANVSHVTFDIPQLPPGKYAFVVVEATGVKQPQRLSMLLQNVNGAWQLAGFFPRPLMTGGHNGVWYWEKARAFKSANQNWNAYFYYETAQYLLVPADFLSSSNLEKLGQEATAITPAGLPGQDPMILQVNGEPVRVTNLHTDASLTGPGGGLDLVVNYETNDVSDPVKSRAKTVAVMKTLLAQHPELKDGFHGLWVFANAPNQRPFGLELPMAEIAAQP